MDRGFAWPWQYNFPPFFTIQLNSDTKRKQLEAWCDLVLSYCKESKTYILDVNEASTSPLFYNQQIKRKLSVETIMIVLETLASQGELLVVADFLPLSLEELSFELQGSEMLRSWFKKYQQVFPWQSRSQLSVHSLV